MMGLPSMTPVLGILNDTDCPDAKMLVVVFGHPSRPGVEYIHLLTRPLRLRGRRKTYPAEFTALADFGCRASFTSSGDLMVLKTHPSRATYSDGVPRNWQGSDGVTIALRSQIAGHVIKAVKASLE